MHQPMGFVRDTDTLFREYQNSTNDIFDKFSFGVEYLIAREATKNKIDPTFENQEWIIQFLPIIAKHWRNLGQLPCSNPGMDGLGALIGASKEKINQHLPQKFLPKSLFIIRSVQNSPDEILNKMRNTGIPFPVICKPDIGERAYGVRFVRNAAELKSYIQTFSHNFLLQEYIDHSSEFGVFCMRNKDTGKFEITSIAEKKLPTITGDGISTVENLIDKLPFSPDKKVKIKSHLSPEELNDIPSQGEIRNVVRMGTISLGTQFTDLTNRAPEIENIIHEILKEFHGFHVGRFDLKANSLEEIAAGNFKIIELNGVGAIPLHIYPDIASSVSQKYAFLKKHFDQVLEICENNQKQNQAKTVSNFQAVKHIMKCLRKKKDQTFLRGLKNNWNITKKISWIFCFIIVTETKNIFQTIK